MVLAIGMTITDRVLPLASLGTAEALAHDNEQDPEYFANVLMWSIKGDARMYYLN